MLKAFKITKKIIKIDHKNTRLKIFQNNLSHLAKVTYYSQIQFKCPGVKF